jgi:hypothetical protein
MSKMETDIEQRAVMMGLALAAPFTFEAAAESTTEIL